VRARRVVTTPERNQHAGRGGVVNGTADVKQRQSLHLDHPHGSSYLLLHPNLKEVAGKRVLTGEKVGATATNNVDGRNGTKVEEGAPSPAP
jgi:hypothetical protein